MKRTFAVAALAGLVLAAAAHAQTTTPAPAPAPAPATAAGNARIAIIAFEAAVELTNEGQRDFADLNKKYEPKRAKLKATNDAIEASQKQYQANADKLSQQEAASQLKSIEQKQKDLQRDAEDLRNESAADADQVFGDLRKKVGEVLVNYAQASGFTVVFNYDQEQTPPVVLWASQSTDITKAVIDAYNVKSGVPAQPAPAKPATAKPAAK
jgi:outer membrane protein